jgi:hypothetical protein
LIDGFDVSWLTREQAIQALTLHTYDSRGSSANVTVMFPDDSALKIAGEDVHISHDALLLIDAALSQGRGNGFIMDTVFFLQHMYSQYVLNDETKRYEIRQIIILEAFE